MALTRISEDKADGKRPAVRIEMECLSGKFLSWHSLSVRGEFNASQSRLNRES